MLSLPQGIVNKTSHMRAILSVSDKAGLVELGRELSSLGVELVSTGGTAKTLAAAGIPVVNVSEITGFPEMMDGRVKTLHPRIHACILARRNRRDDLDAIGAHGIVPVDLVIVNLYPFAKAAENPDTPFDDLVEEIDIGGPSMVRAAAKNFRDVLVVVDPADYPRVIAALRQNGGPTLEFRFELMKKAFAHTAQYDGTIAAALQSVEVADAAFRRGVVPAHATRKDLRYGENPHQHGGWLAGPTGERMWRVHQGKELSYTNLLDLDAAARIVLEFVEPASAVIKHTNPCGVATGQTIAEAYVSARDADALSAFGGIVGLNRELDANVAAALKSTFIEAVIAPSIDDAAREILAAKQNLRVVTADFDALLAAWAAQPVEEYRTFLGGVLAQERDRVTEAQDPWPSGDFPMVVTKRAPTPEQWTALRFAWRVCAHVKSNAVIFTSADRTLAIGAGQMSRVDAVKVAVMKASADALRGTVAASDAFFPFRDGLDAIADTGAVAIVQPGGSMRDADVIAAADERGIAMVFTGRRHFRH
jgi:phosphoribosylaminoimidazolecarboxamide formyltransferase / IMP cyclohydrolase